MDWENYANKRICVAVSGGIDSVCLLHYLRSEQEKYGYLLSAVHCEHGIRGEESLEDKKFVETLCETWEIPLVVFQDDCIEKAKREKLSLETAAREFRTESFERLLRSNCDYIATAHHQKDEAETVLFRIAGGTLSGARGMAEETEKIIRPFLSWTKGEIVAYAAEHGLSYRVDRTNDDVRFSRNKIRKEVLPKLEETVNGATGNIVRFAALLGEDDDLLYRLASKLVTRNDEGYIVAFSEEKPLFRRACLLALKGLGVEKDYTALHLENAYGLQNSERGAKLDLPQNIECEKAETGLVFRVKREEIFEEKGAETPFTENGFDGGRYEVILSKSPFEESTFALKADLDKIPKTAVFRFRKEGDEIKRFGGGTKSLKKFFNERKTSVQEREYIPLIAEKDGKEVYVVCGEEISESVKVDKHTQRVIYIKLRKKKEKVK